MPRIARIVAPGLPHHITQRGNNKREIFHDRKDRLWYCEWFRECAFQYGLTILAYCLMNNHVHFVAIPLAADSLASTFRLLNMRYSHYKNRKTESCGHLWQARFYSCIVEGAHLVQALKYVERNPVRAGMVSKPWEWEWSSAAEHIGERLAHFDCAPISEYSGMTHQEWRAYIAEREEIDSIYNFRKNTLSGFPLVSASCLEELNRGLGINSAPLQQHNETCEQNVNKGVCPPKAKYVNKI
jgi:putative transposase